MNIQNSSSDNLQVSWKDEVGANQAKTAQGTSKCDKKVKKFSIKVSSLEDKLMSFKKEEEQRRADKKLETKEVQKNEKNASGKNWNQKISAFFAKRKK